MAVELKRTSKLLLSAGHKDMAVAVAQKGELIEAAVKRYGIVNHPEFGQVYAFEVDGYGSHIIMGILPPLFAPSKTHC